MLRPIMPGFKISIFYCYSSHIYYYFTFENFFSVVIIANNHTAAESLRLSIVSHKKRPTVHQHSTTTNHKIMNIQRYFELLTVVVVPLCGSRC